MPNYLKLTLLIFICSLAYAGEQEKIAALSAHPHWLKLLHYHKSFTGKSSSAVTTPEFFLSKDGKRDPSSELKATIQLLKTSPDVYCNYPARRRWLEKNGFTFPERECPAFEEWTRGDSIKSVSLIFASGYLGNPASYFGHPLLKFNFKDERSPLDLLDTAINYGAFTPPDVGAIPYAVYGIFGGFDAGFTTTDFFFHRNNYSELELRDMWEYELNLNPSQVQELASHVWEMRQAKIPYYFFSDNCAYRISELMELVVDKELVSRKLPYAIPSTLFHRIHDNGLVKDVRLLKSRQTRLREKVLSLNHKEKGHLKSIVQDSSHVTSEEFHSLDLASKKKVLESGMDYFSYLLILDGDDKKSREAKRVTLKERFSLPPGSSAWTSIPQEPPHKAQRPVLTQFGYIYSENFKSVGSFRFRPAFYDLVSPDAGRPPLSSLAAFDLDLNFNEERLWINQFTFISVETLNISKTGLPKDGGIAWRFKVGADQVNLACRSCLVPMFQAGVGKAWEFSRYLALYAMVDPRLQSEYRSYGHLSLTPNVGLLLTLNDDLRFHAFGGKRYYLNKDSIAEDILLIEGRFGSGRSWDIRTGYQLHEDSRYKLSFGYYW